jgi:hypothetical protein
LAALLLGGGAALCAENFDPRVRDMLRRAYRGEKPTPEDQRTAARALRDWELSERTAPLNEPPYIRHLLRTVIAGDEVRSEQLRTVARDLNDKYLTREGVNRRLRLGPYGRGRVLRGPRGGASAAPPRHPDSAQGWFLFAACLVIMVGGLVVWFLGRRRRRPDYRVYYS